MQTVFTSTQLHHNPACEFLDGNWVEYLESPRRAEMILDAVHAADLGDVIAPHDFGIEPICAVHADHYLDYLQTAYSKWLEQGGAATGVYPDTFFKPGFTHRPTKIGGLAGLYTFDMSTAIVGGTWQAAYWSAQCALTAAKLVRDGERAAFALCRPPGHHAHAAMGGGYCFLNNAAIVAHFLLPSPFRAGGTSLERSEGEAGGGVAILDIDFHHGNGTQDIFYAHDDVLFVSIHADPDRQYPYFLGAASERGAGEGEGFNMNYPLPIKTTDEQYLAVLDGACQQVARFAPRYLIVSLGVDTFSGDPLGDFAMTGAVYPHIGARLAQLNLPTVFVMEGGYAIEQLGANVVGVLGGFQTAVGKW